MNNMAPQDFDLQVKKILDALNTAAGTMGKFHGAGAQKNNPIKEAARETAEATKSIGRSARDIASGLRSASGNLQSTVGGMANTLMRFTSSTEGLIDGIKGVASGFIGGKILGDLFDGARDLSRSYTKVAENGQQFGGSMLQMAQSAANAQLSLGQFEGMFQKFGTTAAVMNGNYSKTGTTLAQLQLEVRKNARQFGMYNMSVDDLIDLTGDYTETLRLSGRVQDINSRETGQSIGTLAKEINDFSAVTGKNRLEIARNSFEALRDVAVTSRIWNDSNKQQKAALDNSVVFLSSLPGGFGKILGKMMAQSVGYGSVLLSDEATDFYEAGAQDIVGVMDTLKQKIDKGNVGTQDYVQFVKSMQQLDVQDRDMLRLQAAAGNQKARQVLEMLGEIRGVNAEEYARNMQQTQAFTAFINTIEEKLGSLTSAFKGGFFDSIKGMEESFAALGDHGLLDHLKNGFEALGKAAGKLLLSVFSRENMEYLDSAITRFGNWLDQGGAQQIYTSFIGWVHMGGVAMKWLFHEAMDWGNTFVKWAKDPEGGGKVLDNVSWVFDQIKQTAIDLIAWARSDDGKKAWDEFKAAMIVVKDVIIDVASVLGSITKFFIGEWKFLDDVFGVFGKNVGIVSASVLTAATAFAAFTAVSSLFSGLKNAIGSMFKALFVKTVTLTAGVVNVFGKGGGLGSGGGGAAGGGKAAAAEEEIEAAGKAAPISEMETAGKTATAVEEAERAVAAGGKVAKSASVLGRMAEAGASILGAGGKLVRGAGPALLGMLGSMAIDHFAPQHMPGKETASKALEYGSYGAAAGVFVPGAGELGISEGVGFGIGAIIGAIKANTDGIADWWHGSKPEAPAKPVDQKPTDPATAKDKDDETEKKAHALMSAKYGDKFDDLTKGTVSFINGFLDPRTLMQDPKLFDQNGFGKDLDIFAQFKDLSTSIAEMPMWKGDAIISTKDAMDEFTKKRDSDETPKQNVFPQPDNNFIGEIKDLSAQQLSILSQIKDLLKTSNKTQKDISSGINQ